MYLDLINKASINYDKFLEKVLIEDLKFKGNIKKLSEVRTFIKENNLSIKLDSDIFEIKNNLTGEIIVLYEGHTTFNTSEKEGNFELVATHKYIRKI